MKYEVDIPIVGFMYVEVEAGSKEEAIELAMNMEWKDDDIQELDKYEKLVEGNVCYTYHSKVTAREIK
jgi:hypothetical protein